MNIMKNFKKLNLVVATLAVAAAVAPVSAFADTKVDDTHRDGTATINFQGQNGKITLDQVPDFDFSTHDLGELLSNGLKFTTNGDKSIKVTNLTGSNDPYTVTAQANELKQGDTVLPVQSFLFNAQNGNKNSFDGLITGAGDQDIYKQSKTVATGDKNANGTLESGTTSANMTLSANNVKNGSYKGDINYTLTSGPAASAQ
ncbi:hypothetical protein G6R29_05950 [Fructobacillus sp. M2-14]|uniref:WxL domain-containing protein n=1 Tax=Fructobacillus broussonetiae TaxID=2713173 RepID=A0ABS5R4U2_9LACO|nr:hypothetical protein [Fructobacillus broussonetiae]MBS9339162.1 hypothetical protein [Fructobacillus broussonetiae]